MQTLVQQNSQIKNVTPNPSASKANPGFLNASIPGSSSKAKASAFLGALSQYSTSACKKQSLSDQQTNDSEHKHSSSSAKRDELPREVRSVCKQSDLSDKQSLPKPPASLQKSMTSSTDSFGSLEELRRELIASVMKELSLENDSEISQSVLSEQTDSSEVHEVFKNSGLKIRGIDVDSLQHADGRQMSVYELFKARFQQPEYGKPKIDNKDVVELVDRFLQQGPTAAGRQFVLHDNSDYRKNAYDLTKDPHFERFRLFCQQQLSKQTAVAQTAAIGDFDA